MYVESMRRRPRAGSARTSKHVAKEYRMSMTNKQRALTVNRLRDRDGGKVCHWCGASPRQSLDHVVAQSLGGPDADWNLVLSCADCNSRRGSEPNPAHCSFCAAAFDRVGAA